jgi:hypothetical protein
MDQHRGQGGQVTHPHRSTSTALDPYLIEDVAMTRADYESARANDCQMVGLR